MASNITSSSAGSTSTGALLNQPIVMDIGTDTTKAGFAGGSKPKVSFLLKYERGKQ